MFAALQFDCIMKLIIHRAKHKYTNTPYGVVFKNAAVAILFEISDEMDSVSHVHYCWMSVLAVLPAFLKLLIQYCKTAAKWQQYCCCIFYWQSDIMVKGHVNHPWLYNVAVLFTFSSQGHKWNIVLYFQIFHWQRRIIKFSGGKL